ncbi:MAG: hypothetical protein FWC36_00285 [Spirochaetes bacterium]|nr:hypothetical protein [Spirochaetota bacterium]
MQEKTCEKEEGITESGRMNKIDWHSLENETTGINIAEGIKRLDDDAEIYFNALLSYAQNTPALLEKITSVSKDKLHDYKIIVHGIKGSSAFVCAEKITGMAEALEIAAKEGNYEYIVANNASFLEETRNLIEEISGIISKIHVNEQKAKKDKPDTELLNKLMAACKDYDMDKVDAVIAELNAYEYESGGEFAAEIAESAKQFDFMKIIDIIDILKQKSNNTVG